MRRVDITGKRFGALTVTCLGNPRVTQSGNPITMWSCDCDCGSIKLISYSNLVTGRVLSCGSRDKHPHPNNGKGASDAGLRQIFSQYKARSKSTLKDFSLTIQEFAEIISKPCYYCGKLPSNTARHDSRFAVVNYSGIDRVDNLRGYVSGNVLPCCGVCNTMKQQLSVSEFISHIVNILQHKRIFIPE